MNEPNGFSARRTAGPTVASGTTPRGRTKPRRWPAIGPVGEFGASCVPAMMYGI